MLHCVYHPVDQMRVVDDAEKEKLLALGVWFETPQEAKAARVKAEEKIAKSKKPKEKESPHEKR